jgi:cytochrome c-type biogenesis protein
LTLLVIVIMGGYWLFRTFVTVVMPDLGAYNLLALAVIAGVASFFSPCSFPLLPGYLSVYYTSSLPVSGAASRWRHTLSRGGAAVLGVVTFNLLLGAIIGLLGAGVARGLSIGGAEPSTYVLFLRGGGGIVLLVLGIVQFAGWNFKPTFVDAFSYYTRPKRKGTAAGSLYLYGLGYSTAGMGCTGPILAGLTIFALSPGGPASALSAFAVFSATMGGLMLLVSVLVAASQDTLIRRLKSTSPRIKQAASILLIAVGSFNVTASLTVREFVRLLFP